MKMISKAGPAGLIVLLALFLSVPASAAGARDDIRKFQAHNIDLVREFLAAASKPGPAFDDYYFVLIGDIQNSPKDLGHPVFNAIAKEMRKAEDPKTGQRIYGRIRFIILNGDLVHEGSSPRQWDALGKAFEGEGPDGASYPYLRALIREKPIIPVTGNHELLRFRPQIPNHYTDLMDSTKGPVSLKAFFDWDRWIRSPDILYPVPADLPADDFREILANLGDTGEARYLADQYALKKDGRFYLKFNENPPLDEAEYRAGKERLAPRLAAIFRKAGYGTLPVLNSDNMFCYAFEAGNVVYLVLDSMARGWHYPNFARLKRTLYPEKDEQHLLNLFSASPFNGQSDFYYAVAAYAREHGRTLVVSMHSPIFNSSRAVTNPGVGYNTWLDLGLPQPGSEKGAPSIFDDALFRDVSDVFSSCVHAYEHFTLIARAPGAADHIVQCTISGGGGGPLRANIHAGKTQPWVDAYNKKLEDLGGPLTGRSVEIENDVVGEGHHYLLVHVVDGRVVDAAPRFTDPEDFRKPAFNPHLALAASYLSAPGSVATSLEFSPGDWGMNRLNGYLTFLNWRPSVSLGIVSYDASNTGPGVRASAAVIGVSPLTIDFHLPGSNLISFPLLGFEAWLGGGNLRRYFLTNGVEAPLVYDLFGVVRDLEIAIKVYSPLNLGGNSNAEFGRRTKIGFSAGYRFRL
jgi:hypothetical protein